MGFLDQFAKTAGRVVDRTRFEAEKFQKTSRIQGELSDIKHQRDQILIELGQRVHDLYHAGQVQASSVADLVQRVDQLRGEVIRKEDELRQAQAEVFVEPAQPAPGEVAPSPGGEEAPSSSTTPSFKGQHATQPDAPSAPTPPGTQTETRTCPACSYQMPAKAVYCPNCGFRVGTPTTPPADESQ